VSLEKAAKNNKKEWVAPIRINRLADNILICPKQIEFAATKKRYSYISVFLPPIPSLSTSEITAVPRLVIV